MALDLKGIQERVKAATPGKWYMELGSEREDFGGEEHHIFMDGADGQQHLIAQTNYDTLNRRKDEPTFLTSHADAEFIAHARTDIPALLAALEVARKVVDAAERFDQGVFDYAHREQHWKDLSDTLAAYHAQVGE